MTNIVKQTAGIDVALNELVVSLGQMSHDTGVEIFAFKTFANNVKGFNDLVAWVKKLATKEMKVRYVMEATGVYHEKLAYYLSDKGHKAVHGYLYHKTQLHRLNGTCRLETPFSNNYLAPQLRAAV